MPTKSQLQKALDECRANRATDKETLSKQADEVAGLKLALADCEGSEPPPEPTPTPTPTPLPVPKWYAPTSIWNVKRDTSRAVDSNSAAMAQQIHSDQARDTSRFMSSDAYGHPIFYATVNDPLVRINLTVSYRNLDVHGKSIRVPAAAKPAVGSDGHLCVVQPDGVHWDFWQAKPVSAGVLTATQGGRIPINGTGMGSTPMATAMGCGLPAGVIMVDELKAGAIPHALFMVTAHTSGQKVNGARSTGSVGSGARPAMGQRFFLDSAYQPPSTLKPWQRAIQVAFRDYGAYVADTGGGMLKADMSAALGTFGQELGLTRNPEGRYVFDCPFPWDKLKAEALA